MTIVESAHLAFSPLGLGGWDIPIILFLILLLFGAKRLPELASSMGRSLREFKKAATDAEESFREAVDLESEKTQKSESHKPKPDPASNPRAEAATPDNNEAGQKEATRQV